MIEYELKKVYNCSQCGEEVVVTYNPELEYVARDRCMQCRARESKESTDRLLKAVLREMNKLSNESDNVRV